MYNFINVFLKVYKRKDFGTSTSLNNVHKWGLEVLGVFYA